MDAGWGSWSTSERTMTWIGSMCWTSSALHLLGPTLEVISRAVVKSSSVAVPALVETTCAVAAVQWCGGQRSRGSRRGRECSGGPCVGDRGNEGSSTLQAGGGLVSMLLGRVIRYVSCSIPWIMRRF